MNPKIHTQLHSEALVENLPANENNHQVGKTAKKEVGQNVKHGHYRNNSESKVHMAWRSLINRCYGSKPQHKSYRERNIQVCNRWRFGENGIHPFVLFLQDVGFPPDKFYSIDRINNDGNYEPSNVRWATSKQQANNRSKTRKLTLDGITKTLTEWSEHFEWPHSVIWGRIQLGWSDEKILTTPRMNSAPSLNDLKPWEKMGVSKSTWRRKGNNKLTLIAEYCRRTNP